MAKVIQTGPRVPDWLPTFTHEVTREGAFTGTAAYASPEQARGEELDRRTDIWSFGCVLYEMLTGRRAFSGRPVSETIAAVLEREPAWDALPETTPPAIRSLLMRCLRKDRAQRIRDVADAGLEIEEALHAPGRDADAGGRSVPETAAGHRSSPTSRHRRSTRDASPDRGVKLATPVPRRRGTG